MPATRAEEKARKRLDELYMASLTPLERFIIWNDIRPAHLAVASGYSRQHLLRIRMGRMEPTRRCIAAIVAGIRSLTRQHVSVLDLFQFDDGPACSPHGQRKDDKPRRKNS